jgi:hypothetical protein
VIYALAIILSVPTGPVGALILAAKLLEAAKPTP